MARFSNSVSVQAYVAAVWVDASMSMAIDGDSPLQWPNANSALARWPNNINNNKWAVHARADLGLCDSRRQCRNCRRRSRGEKCVCVCVLRSHSMRVCARISPWLQHLNEMIPIQRANVRPASQRCGTYCDGPAHKPHGNYYCSARLHFSFCCFKVFFFFCFCALWIKRPSWPANEPVLFTVSGRLSTRPMTNGDWWREETMAIIVVVCCRLVLSCRTNLHFSKLIVCFISSTESLMCMCVWLFGSIMLESSSCQLWCTHCDWHICNKQKRRSTKLHSKYGKRDCMTMGQSNRRK